MSRLLLVRHAATDWSGVRFCGRTDLPLREPGRAQVTQLRERLASMQLSVGAVRSSPARRALETAQPLARALCATLEPDDRLREVDFGLVEGSAFDDVARTWPAIATALLAGGGAIDWPEGERAADVVARLRPLVPELAVIERDVVLVTHGGAIRALVTLLRIPSTAELDLAPAQFLVLEREPLWHLVGKSGSAERKGAQLR